MPASAQHHRGIAAEFDEDVLVVDLDPGTTSFSATHINRYRVTTEMLTRIDWAVQCPHAVHTLSSRIRDHLYA